MSPPIYTPDGSEVSEIVLPDGSTASQVIGPDGNVVFEAGPDIPDSAIAQYDATQESYSDNESISVITDQIGNADFEGGSGEFDTTGLNGNPAYDLNEFSDGFSAGGDLEIGDSYSIILVVELVNDSSQTRILDRDTGDFVLYWDDGVEWRHIAPSSANDSVVGSSDSSKQLITATKDGSTVTIRENGSETGSRTNAGTGSTSQPVIESGSDAWSGYIGEMIFYKPVLSSSELSSEESRLIDKWGITV